MGEGCDCTELCSMGPTCPGGMLARLDGAGCWRTSQPEHPCTHYGEGGYCRIPTQHKTPTGWRCASHTPMTPAVPDPTVEARIAEVLAAHYPHPVFGCECTPEDDDSGIKESLATSWERHVAAVLTARAAAPDALRVAVEALASEWGRLADGNEVARGRNTKVAAYYRRHAAQLRALLDDGGQ